MNAPWWIWRPVQTRLTKWTSALLRGTRYTVRLTPEGTGYHDREGKVIQANPVAHEWLSQTLSPEEASRLRHAVRDVVTRVDERATQLLALKDLDLELNAAPISPPQGEAALQRMQDADKLHPSTIQPAQGKPKAVVAVHDARHLKALDRMRAHSSPTYPTNSAPLSPRSSCTPT